MHKSQCSECINYCCNVCMKMDVGFLFAVSVLGFLLVYLMLKTRRRDNEIPGPKGWPLVGIAFDVSQETIHLQMFDFAKKYGEIMKISILGSDIVFLNSETLIRHAYAEGDVRILLNDRSPLYIVSNFPQISNSLVFAQNAFGEPHDTLRKLFTKGFQVCGDGVKKNETNVQIAIESLIQRIQKLDGEEFEVVSVMRSSVVDLMSVLLCGLEFSDYNEYDNMCAQYTNAVDNMVSPTVDGVLRVAPFLRNIPGFYKNRVDRLKHCIDQLLDFYYKQKSSYDPTLMRGFVDFLLEEQRRAEEMDPSNLLTDELMTGVISDLILAGIFTTATLSSTVLLLTQYSDVQEKVRREIFDVIGRSRMPTIGDKSNCPYNEAVFMEVQRYATVAPIGAVHFSREDVKLRDYTIPKGTQVFSNLWCVSHNETVWGDPWNFRPERFLDEKGQLLPRSHPLRKNLLAFGIGRRQCVGEQFARSRIFLYVTSLLQRWTFVKSSGNFPKSCDPRDGSFEFKAALTPKPFCCKFVEND